MMGQPTHVGGQAAHSQACSGPTLVSKVLSPLLPEFCDFRNRILYCCRGLSPPHLFPLYLYAQHMETNTYPKEIESR
jgi:hypothetical protein